MLGEHLAGLEAHPWRTALQGQVNALGEACGGAELQAQLDLPPRTGKEAERLEAHLEARLTSASHQAADQPKQKGPRNHLGVDPQPRLDAKAKSSASTGELHNWYQASEQRYVSVKRKLGTTKCPYRKNRCTTAKDSGKAHTNLRVYWWTAKAEGRPGF